MNRRELLALTAGAILTPDWVRAAEKQYRIAALVRSLPPGGWPRVLKSAFGRAFDSELHCLDEIEGQNLVVERFNAEGHIERFAAVALAGAKPADLPGDAAQPVQAGAQPEDREGARINGFPATLLARPDEARLIV